MTDLLTPRQIRAARALLGWSMLELSRAAAVSVSTVKRAEESAPEGVTPATMGVIRGALEARGVSFLRDAATEGVSIRLRCPMLAGRGDGAAPDRLAVD